MQTINSATLTAVQRGFRVFYNDDYRRTVSVVDRFATIRDSTNAEEALIFATSLPRMRKWLGERILNNFAAQESKVVNEPYELSVKVRREDIEDDKVGIYEPQIRDLGRRGKMIFQDLATEALLNSHLALGYDGQAITDTDHPVRPGDPGSPTQSNLFTTRPFNEANYSYVRTQMSMFLGEDGRPLGVRPNLLMVGPALEMEARRVLNATTLANGADNIMRGTSELIVVPDIVGTDWYMLDTTNAMKPILVSRRKEAEFVALDSPDDENVFMRRLFYYGVDARGAATYGPWFLMAKATAA